MIDGQHISQEDLALYAMQALSATESAEIRAHVEECAVCRAELASATGDMALVALGVEQHAPPLGARQRFLERVSKSPAGALSAQPAKAGAVGRVTAIDRRPRSFATWIAWGAVAALVVLAISLGMQIQRLNARLQEQAETAARLASTNARAQEVLEVLTAPKAQRILLTAAKSPVLPTGRAVYLAESGGLIFQANNLARLDENKTYELWVIPANGAPPMPAGLFRPDAGGNASVVLPPIPKGVPAKAFGVTIEKASGSETPTLPIILSGAAPAAGE